MCSSTAPFSLDPLQQEGALPAMEESADLPVERGTHIHDLSADCLLKVLSLVGNEVLPIERPKFRDFQTLHPLQCALVCKRWHSFARASVHSLSLGSTAMEEHLAEHAKDFTGLRVLHLVGGTGAQCILHQIARATPALEHLELDWTCRPPIDVLSALMSWTNLRQLKLDGDDWGHFKGTMLPTLLGVLPTLTAIQNLSLNYDGIESKVLWDRLRLQMTQLKELSLRCMDQPPPSLAEIPSLRLTLLGSLPLYVAQFTNILQLELFLFEEEEVPAELGSMSRLLSLTFDKSYTLTRLPSTLGQLSSLVYLRISACSKLSCLPESIGDLRMLKELHVYSCGGLLMLPESLAKLPNLTCLSLKDMQPEVLLEGLGGLSKLEDLYMSSYEYPPFRLRATPEILGGLKRVTQVTLELPWLRTLPRSFGDLSFLRMIHLKGVRVLRALPNSFCELKCLESLDLTRCGITSLPETFGQLSALTRLNMESCHYVSVLPESMSGLSNLLELRVEACSGFAYLPVEFAKLTNLRELWIRNCEVFSDRMGVIPCLVSLRALGLAGCRGQSCLPRGLEKHTALQMIKCSAGMIQRASLELLPILVPDLEAMYIEEEDEEHVDEESNEDDDINFSQIMHEGGRQHTTGDCLEDEDEGSG